MPPFLTPSEDPALLFPVPAVVLIVGTLAASSFLHSSLRRVRAFLVDRSGLHRRPPEVPHSDSNVLSDFLSLFRRAGRARDGSPLFLFLTFAQEESDFFFAPPWVRLPLSCRCLLLRSCVPFSLPLHAASRLFIFRRLKSFSSLPRPRRFHVKAEQLPPMFLSTRLLSPTCCHDPTVFWLRSLSPLPCSLIHMFGLVP